MGTTIAQNIPNPFLAPVQEPPPLYGTPPNSEPPKPEPTVAPTPTTFHPYDLPAVPVSAPHDPLAPILTAPFNFTAGDLLPLPTPQQLAEQQAAAQAQETPSEDDSQLNEPTLETADAAESNNPNLGSQDGGEPTLASASDNDTSALEHTPEPQPVTPTREGVEVLGITTGINPTVMLRVNGSTAPYRAGDELPNGYVVESIDALSVTLHKTPEEREPETTPAGDSTGDEQPAVLNIPIR